MKDRESARRRRPVMAVRLSKLFRKEIAILAPVLACIVCLRNTPALLVHFDSIKEFEDFAVKNGLLLYASGRGSLGNNLYVAERPVNSERLAALTKMDCGLTLD